MSSEEEKYFNIPTNRTGNRFKKYNQKINILQILKIDFLKKKIIKTFGLFLKIKKSQDQQIGLIENGSELEQPLAIARDIKKLYGDIIFI